MSTKLAIQINDVLHKALAENDKLAYHMARGLSEKIAEAITANSKREGAWEYVVRTYHNTNPASLTGELDADGEFWWELVSFDFANNRAILKRRKRVDI